MLIEVKSIGLELKDAFVKQAVDYAANQGVEWVILTNGADWHVYRVTFGKPINQEMVLSIDFLAVNSKSAGDVDSLYLLTKEGISKSVLGDYQAQRQALSRFFIGATILSDPVLDVIRRELRRMSPDVKIDTEQIKTVLMQDVFKREVVEGEKADEARKKIARSLAKTLRKATKATAGTGEAEDEGVADQPDDVPAALPA
jgi:hypothetical protein